MAAGVVAAGWASPGSGADVGEVTIAPRRFMPAQVRIQAGGEVVWTHGGRGRHTVTADDGAFHSGVLRPRSQFQRTFHQPGRYRYHCRFHGDDGGVAMSGVVVVEPGAERPPGWPESLSPAGCAGACGR